MTGFVYNTVSWNTDHKAQAMYEIYIVLQKVYQQ